MACAGCARSIACARHPWCIDVLPAFPPCLRELGPLFRSLPAPGGGPRLGSRLLQGSRGGTRERWGRRGCWPAAGVPAQGRVPDARCIWRLPGKPPSSSAPERRPCARSCAALPHCSLSQTRFTWWWQKTIQLRIVPARSQELQPAGDAAGPANPGRRQAPLPLQTSAPAKPNSC